ncbi:phage major capsid protein [Nonomuraea sp. NPDC050328]|uniref:phage major capsid protein n=1 Tax=Nonomuraea sp. NPDC050328 TaxID=3364361 RepID=UPI0037AAF004
MAYFTYGKSLSELKDDLTTMRARLKELTSKATHTTAEKVELDTLSDATMNAVRALERKQSQKTLNDALKELNGGAVPPVGGNGAVTWGEKTLRRMLGGDRPGDLFGAKAVLSPTGAVTTPVAAPAPYVQGQPATSLLSLIPRQPTDTHFSYLRQTTRTNNAAPVAEGARKPTSIYTLELIEDRCRVIAHLSEEVPRQVLADLPALQQFLDGEMRYGIDLAVEGQILNGSGAGENMRGILNTSGVQVQAFATSKLLSIRSGITKLQNLGYEAGAIALRPVDWEAIETSVTDAGSFIGAEAGQGTPVDAMRRTLYGVPVALSLAVPADKAVVFDPRKVQLNTREEVRLDWSESVYKPDRFGAGQGGTAFEANMITFRAEGRFGLEIHAPSSAVSVSLVA